MNVFDLMATISLDTGEYEKSLTGASKSSSDFAGKMKSGLATAGKVGAAAIGAASAAVGVLGKIGLDYNSQMETYTTNFKVMLGGNEAAVEKVEELKTMAAKTPFGMADLADATQTLLAFQVPAEETTGILKQLGDISLGNSQKLSGLSLVFGQVSSAGKLTGQDLMQFINQGFNPLNYIAERTGESMEELRDRMSKGAIGTDEIKQAFIDATSEGGQFFNGMEEGSKTTDGLISTLKDNVSSKLGDAFQSVSTILKDELLPKAIEFVESIDVEQIVSDVQGLIDKFVSLSPVIAGGVAALVAFKAASAISGVMDALKLATEGQTIAQAALTAVMNLSPFVRIATLVMGLVTAIGVLWATNEDFRNAVTEIWDGIKGAFSDAWDAIRGVWDAVKPYFDAIWDAISSAFGAAEEFLGGAFDGAWSAIKVVWDTVAGYFDAIWNTVEGVFAVVESVLSGDFSGAWEAIKDVFSGWKKFFDNLWEDVKDVFSDVLGTFKDVGKDILSGIWNGIADKVEWLKGKVTGVVDTIKNWFTGKDGFDENSPSKWSRQVFRYIMDGGGQGLDDGAQSLYRSVDTIVGTVKSGMDFGTANIDFASSGLGASSSGIINGVSGLSGAVASSAGSMSFNLVLPDGTTLASYLLPSLVDVSKSNGTPILNPT